MKKDHTTTLNCKSSTVGPLHENELASFKQQIDSNPQINVSPGKNLLTFHYTGGLIPGSKHFMLYYCNPPQSCVEFHPQQIPWTTKRGPFFIAHVDKLHKTFPNLTLLGELNRSSMSLVDDDGKTQVSRNKTNGGWSGKSNLWTKINIISQPPSFCGCSEFWWVYVSRRSMAKIISLSGNTVQT